MDFQLLYWYWLVFGMLLVMVEIALPSFTALWFGLGALLVGVILLIVPSMATVWQVFIWTVSSAFFTLVWFKWLKPKSIDQTKAGLSREAIVGESGQVISEPHEGKRGILRFTLPILGSEEWSFICSQPVMVGDRVTVVDISGNTLVVEKR